MLHIFNHPLNRYKLEMYDFRKLRSMLSKHLWIRQYIWSLHPFNSICVGVWRYFFCCVFLLLFVWGCCFGFLFFVVSGFLKGLWFYCAVMSGSKDGVRHRQHSLLTSLQVPKQKHPCSFLPIDNAYQMDVDLVTELAVVHGSCSCLFYSCLSNNYSSTSMPLK